MNVFFSAIRLSSANRAELSLLDKPEKFIAHTDTHMYTYKYNVFVHGSHNQDG